jgi:hypothetical protein
MSNRSRHYGLIALGVVVAVALVVGATALLVGKIRDSGAIPLGRGSATISWVSTGGSTSASQPFTGRAAGLAVTGTANLPNPNSSYRTSTSGSPAFPSKVSIFHVTGTIDGRTFTLDPYYTFLKEFDTLPTTPLQPLTCTPTSNAYSVGSECALPPPTVVHGGSAVTRPLVLGDVTGTYGSLRISAALTLDGNRSFGFAGTIGTVHVTGVVEDLTRHGETEIAHATFQLTE